MFRISSALFGKVLVLAESCGGKLSPSTLSALTAARHCGEITALLPFAHAKTLATELQKYDNIKAVHVTEAEQYHHGLAEEVAALLVDQIEKGGFTHVFAGASAYAKGILPRAAAKFDSMPISDVVAVKSENEFVRNCYAGNVVLTVRSHNKVKFVVVTAAAFDRSKPGSGNAEILDVPPLAPKGQSKWLGERAGDTDKPDLSSARVIVSGGRGLKDKVGFAMVGELADLLKGAVGATRAVVDAGFAPNDVQIGQTGKNVAPELYIAVAISGAIQHTAGMKNSKVIICINSDADAPLFQISDYGLKADAFKAVPELIAKIKEGK